MFKFGFARDTVDRDEEAGEKKEKLAWIPASKLQITSEQIEEKYEGDYCTETKVFPGYNLRLIRFDKIMENFISTWKQNQQNIVEAELQHSDLIPAKYEGGLKIWECTFDLGKYILKEEIELKDKLVLDLGCGAGLTGILALLKNSIVHFQDYNAEVLRFLTVPNVLLNFDDRTSVSTRCELYAGDWESFAMLFDDDENRRCDYIFTSETIYNPDNYRKLHDVFKKRLKIDGVVFVAGKTYYFGVGGGMRQFESFVLKEGYFDIETVWRNQDGVNREILKLTRKTC
ncbi:histidine protein methyltransferase 1 homolog isoform X2 [Odontomachus brunneus]|uniref:histidine protein methyltransferase 1 homolog isoform X2 n=1 Tax=Odontomachus brunneus TaxID=486640 RepID=UPI0013F1A3CC|nr:histidine protein methyltransferase 1 homolog isoform X2 [Odontomachus brunneus]